MPRLSKIRKKVAMAYLFRRVFTGSHAAYLPQSEEQKDIFLSLPDAEFLGRCSKYLLGDVPDDDALVNLGKQLEGGADRAKFFKSLFYSAESAAYRSDARLSLPPEPAYPFRKNGGTGKKVLVVSNCQTLGLANCLSLHCDNARVEACDMWTFRKKSKYWLGRIREFDLIFGSQGPELDGIIDFTQQPKTHLIPGFHMECYHKDLTYCWQGETRVKTPLDDYHSKICLTAYLLGASVQSTVKMFDGETYRALGYLSNWERDRDSFIAMYGAYGLDVRGTFLEWARKGMIPHSVNHPTIAMLSDLARLMAKKAGLTLLDHALLPHDNLANGPIFPVYPEIAIERGLSTGSYRFKAVNQYITLSLGEFVRQSFERYLKLSPQDPRFARLDERAVAYLASRDRL